MTFVDWDELARWKMIDIALELGLPEPVETYSSSPHFFEALGIPTDASGRLVAVAKGEPEAKRDRPARNGSSGKSANSPSNTGKKLPIGDQIVKREPRQPSTRVRTRTKRTISE